jgi:L-rhamnose mutarotase
MRERGRRVVLTLDLAEDAALQAEYRRHHAAVPPEIVQSIGDSGILAMEIYNLGRRLVMVLEVSPEFTFERKAELDRANSTVQEWEKLMWEYQRALPEAQPGEKWIPMEKIFDY